MRVCSHQEPVKFRGRESYLLPCVNLYFCQLPMLLICQGFQEFQGLTSLSLQSSLCSLVKDKRLDFGFGAIQSSSGTQRHEAVWGTCQELESSVFLLVHFLINRVTAFLVAFSQIVNCLTLFYPLPHISSLLSQLGPFCSWYSPFNFHINCLFFLGLHSRLELVSNSMRLNEFISLRTESTKKSFSGNSLDKYILSFELCSTLNVSKL